MHTMEHTNQTLEKQIEEINKALNEVTVNQEHERIFLENSHATNMKKLDKLQEYNKIADMTNQLFEKRLQGIENAIKRISESIKI